MIDVVKNEKLKGYDLAGEVLCSLNGTDKARLADLMSDLRCTMMQLRAALAAIPVRYGVELATATVQSGGCVWVKSSPMLAQTRAMEYWREVYGE